MLNRLIQFSLAQRPLILVAAVVVLALGLNSLVKSPVEVLPDLTKPTVTIMTEAPGFAPEEVETLITVPLENALMGVTGVDRLRTTTDVGLSLVFVEFDWGTNIYDARDFVQERLLGVTEELPEEVSPYMTPVASLMGEIFLIGVTDPTGEMAPRDVRVMADWDVARRLQGIPGVAEVVAMGGGVKQVQVQPDPQRMLAHDVSFEQLREAAREAASNTTGGFLTNRAQEIMVRNLAMTTDPDVIGRTVVKHVNDRPVRLKDVADVKWEIEPPRGDAAVNGYPGVILSVTKSPGFDTLALTERVEKAMRELENELPEQIEIQPVYRQANYIELSIGNLEEALRDGAIMVAIILFLFLFNIRTTFITLMAMPLSLGIAFLVFDWFNLSVNSMTLGGLAVAIGMVVDDAIVDVENVYRRLRENAGLEKPRSKLEVIASASREVRSSIFYATVLIVLVFVPLLALTGVEGRLFTPIAIATIVSMSASFLVSLTVIPVLSSFLLNPKPGKEQKDRFFVRFLKWLHKNTWLRLALDQPRVVMVIAVLLIAFAVSLYPQMSKNFLPPFKEPTVLVAMTTSPGTSLQQTNEIAAAADNLLLSIPEVERVSRRVGRAERGDHVVPVSTAEFDIQFHDRGRPREEIVEDIREKMQSLPGTFSALSSPMEDRIGHMLSGVSAPIAIKIFGDDLKELRRIGTEIQTIAKQIPGLAEARTEQQALIPQLRIEVDRERAVAYGVTPGELNEELATLIGGEVVQQIYEGQIIYDLAVRLPDEWRESTEKLANMYIDTKSGQQVPLKFVADLHSAAGPNTILRENTQRRFVVSINPTTENLVELVDRLRAEVSEKVDLPEGYFIRYEGAYEAQREASRRIAWMSALILFIIAVLLYGFFRTPLFTVQILADIPLALIGGIILTWLTLNNISIATLVGFIAVAGIAARNSIMMISHYLHLMRHEGEGFTREMIERGTLERLVPVLMTALSASLALVPLLIAGHEPGKEILNPVAIVIVGGLITSTFLGLGVTPAVFYTFGRRAAEKSVAEESAASI